MKKIFTLLILSVVLLAGCNVDKQTMVIHEKESADFIEIKETTTPKGFESIKGQSLSKPPELTVSIVNKGIAAVCGTFSWFIDSGDGIVKCIEADSGPPNELVKNQKESLYVKPNSRIFLSFESKPINYKVGIWENDKSINQRVKNGEITTPREKGLVIYEVKAEWQQGTAIYAFAINMDL